MTHFEHSTLVLSYIQLGVTLSFGFIGIVGLAAYFLQKKSAKQESDKGILDTIRLGYENIDDMLTCPMTRGRWISIVLVLNEIEHIRYTLELSKSKESYNSMLSMFRVLYYDRLFSLPAGAYVDGHYDPKDMNLIASKEVLSKVTTVRSDLCPIAGEDVMYFIWQHFKFPKDWETFMESTSFTKKYAMMNENENLREQFEIATWIMYSNVGPTDGKFRVYQQGTRNGYCSVYSLQRDLETGKIRRSPYEDEKE